MRLTTKALKHSLEKLRMKALDPIIRSIEDPITDEAATRIIYAAIKKCPKIMQSPLSDELKEISLSVKPIPSKTQTKKLR